MKIKNDALLFKNILWATAALLILTVAFSMLFETGKAPVQLTINDLVKKINSGEVQKITVSGNDLSIDLKNSEKAVAKKESESGFSQTLSNYGVNIKAPQAVSVEV